MDKRFAILRVTESFNPRWFGKCAPGCASLRFDLPWLVGNRVSSFGVNARVIPSVAYTDPEVAWVGLTEDQAKAQGINIKKGLFPWNASGRAIANGRDEGVTKLLFDDSPEEGSDGHGNGRSHGRILGGGMVGTHAGDMTGEVALTIGMDADAVNIGKTIHPHPTLGESIGMAAEVAHVTTDF